MICRASVVFLVAQVAWCFLPDERPDLFEGDIELAPTSGFRSALNDRSRLWDDGVVYYEFSPRSYFDEEERANITAAMEEFHRHTCIRWVPRTYQDKYIIFQSGNGCSSNVGKLRISVGTFKQRIMLGPGCLNKGTIMHEMMHTVGFFHEQSRWDRDDYVRIRTENIRQGLLDQFRIHRLADQNKDLGAPYDYDSLMHYRKNTFTENDEDTIVPIKEGVTIGQRERFSELDIWKMNKLYRCPGYESATLPEEMFIKPEQLPERPPYPTQLKTEFGCTFDQKWACDFHDEISNDLDWKVRGGAASRSGTTGPSEDAYNGECCYIHIHTVGHEPGQSARLVGPFLKARTPSCLSFWYHMKGKSIGTLRVYIRDYRGEKGDVIFEKTGQQSNYWLQANVPVENLTPFQLIFEATVGDSPYSSYEGDIAIDSVSYKDRASMRSYDRC